MSCGCNKPNERHGDDRNIVMQDLKDAATAAKISTAEVVKNIQAGFDGAHGARESQAAAQR
jgi:hypothetical protein